MTKFVIYRCTEDNTIRVVSTDKLATEERPHVSDKDLDIGSKVIWRYGGLPYEAKVLATLGELLIVILLYHL